MSSNNRQLSSQQGFHSPAFWEFKVGTPTRLGMDFLLIV